MPHTPATTVPAAATGLDLIATTKAIAARLTGEERDCFLVILRCAWKHAGSWEELAEELEG